MTTKYHFLHDAHSPRAPHVELGPSPQPAAKPKQANRRLHRLATVRNEQEMTLKSVARRLNCRTREARQQEKETNDLTISELLKWQEVLNVPLSHLLVDPEPDLSTPVLTRAKLVQVMKTVVALNEQDDITRMRRLIAMLQEQLINIMPELESVNAWHSVGQRKGRDDFGRAVERCVDDRLVAER